MKLTPKQIKLLKTLGHQLSPIITIADQGLKDTIRDDTIEALRVHELVKVKIRTDARETRREIIDTLVTETGAVLINSIGHTALLFKRNMLQPKIALKTSS